MRLNCLPTVGNKSEMILESDTFSLNSAIRMNCIQLRYTEKNICMIVTVYLQLDAQFTDKLLINCKI